MTTHTRACRGILHFNSPRISGDSSTLLAPPAPLLSDGSSERMTLPKSGGAYFFDWTPARFCDILLLPLLIIAREPRHG